MVKRTVVALVAVGCLASVSGCHPYEWKIDYHQATVGHVGCPKSEIEISLDGKPEIYGDTQEFHMRVHNWRARCRGKVYYCAIQRGVYKTIDTVGALTVNCHVEVPSAPTWQRGSSTRPPLPNSSAYPDGTPKGADAPTAAPTIQLPSEPPASPAPATSTPPQAPASAPK